LGYPLKNKHWGGLASYSQGFSRPLVASMTYRCKVPNLEILVKRLRQALSHATRAIAIFMAFILISAVFTYFKPISVETIGYQYYGDKTYRVEKTNQITDLLHGEKLMRRKVNQIRSQTSYPQGQINLALSWVTQSVRPQDASPSPVISDDYYNILKRGAGYCDQAAYVFSVLSTRLGIPARMIMLQDRDGISRHTAAEVYLDKKWQYIDPWLGVFPHKSDGSGYTRFEFAHDQSALEKYGYTRQGLTGYDFAQSKIFETFPFMSTTNLVRKVFSKFGNLRESSSSTPGGLSNVEQIDEVNLAMGLTDKQLDVLQLFDQARELHLNEDFDGARGIYSKLLCDQELLVINDSARFFFGVTYFDERKYKDTEEYFKREIANHPNSVWKNSEYRFLAESLIAQGKVSDAKTWLEKASSQGAMVRLKNLEVRLVHGIYKGFISY
jgi:tetratricopeptide (TPR) repeat protein